MICATAVGKNLPLSGWFKLLHLKGWLVCLSSMPWNFSRLLHSPTWRPRSHTGGRIFIYKTDIWQGWAVCGIMLHSKWLLLTRTKLMKKSKNRRVSLKKKVSFLTLYSHSYTSTSINLTQDNPMNFLGAARDFAFTTHTQISQMHHKISFMQSHLEREELYKPFNIIYEHIHTKITHHRARGIQQEKPIKDDWLSTDVTHSSHGICNAVMENVQRQT